LFSLVSKTIREKLMSFGDRGTINRKRPNSPS
jgi:hypothetical protein